MVTRVTYTLKCQLSSRIIVTRVIAHLEAHTLWRSISARLGMANILLVIVSMRAGVGVNVEPDMLCFSTSETQDI